MQNAKDSFYMTLRARLAIINPERTVLLRGTLRPGILVEEAEAPPRYYPPMFLFYAGWGLAPTWISVPRCWLRSVRFSTARAARRHSAGLIEDAC